MGRAIVQEMGTGLSGGLSTLCLGGRKCAEGDRNSGIDGSTVILKVFPRSDAVGGVVRQKWKSMSPEFLECPRGPQRPRKFSDTMGTYFFHFYDSTTPTTALQGE